MRGLRGEEGPNSGGEGRGEERKDQVLRGLKDHLFGGAGVMLIS